ncbi:MAG: hypothetical protein GX763_02190 [Clostridiaceae bacterium]|nr:hypothetical protein [Clostridiaceae bacterium]
MTKDSYPAYFHYIHKAMFDIDYPTTLDIVLEKAGDRLINVDWDEQLPFRELLSSMIKKEFSCAADFYCAFIASA